MLFLVKGIELGYQQALRFLPGALSRLIVGVNETYTHLSTTLSRFDKKNAAMLSRDVVLPGQSARIMNLMVGSESGAFSGRLAAGQLRFSNSGRMAATSADGKTVLTTPVDALMALSALVEIAAGLAVELGRDFRQYIPDEQARLLAWANDAGDFFSKGPGAAADSPVSYKMAECLLTDFFDEAEQGSSGHLATFRFSHAEIIIPLATLLGVPGSATPLAEGQAYSYASNPWRGSDVAPYAANIQWDSVRNAEGPLLVRMLYNEKETPFKRDCDGARFSPRSYFYDVQALRRC